VLLILWGVEVVPPEGFTSVSLPKKIVAMIRQVVENPTSPYNTISEFVRDAIREKLESDQIRALPTYQHTNIPTYKQHIAWCGPL
jgi:Arc/MetJ-type ribon-helix-helix transcriptional regulator